MELMCADDWAAVWGNSGAETSATPTSAGMSTRDNTFTLHYTGVHHWPPHQDLVVTQHQCGGFSGREQQRHPHPAVKLEVSVDVIEQLQTWLISPRVGEWTGREAIARIAAPRFALCFCLCEEAVAWSQWHRQAKTTHFHGKLASITAFTAQRKLVWNERRGEQRELVMAEGNFQSLSKSLKLSGGPGPWPNASTSGSPLTGLYGGLLDI